MKLAFRYLIIIPLVLAVNSGCSHSSLSQHGIVQGVMEHLKDRTFRGQDTVFNQQTLVWYAKEMNISDTDFAIALNYPSPYQPSLDVHLRLAQADTVSISYFDLNRTLLSTPYSGFLGRGDYTYHVVNTALHNGKYYVKSTIGQRKWIQFGYILVVK